MKRPWLIVILVAVLCTMIPQVTAQETLSWDVYQTTWTQINYENVTDIWVSHPVNGSLVSDNQKLTLIVVPFDVDQLIYKIDIYKNDILMYTCNREKVYDLTIYTTNPVNSVVTVIIKLNNKEVLTLEYYAVLTSPSLDADYTEQWLIYQQQKQNDTLSGQDIVDRKDKALSNMNTVLVTGGLCILFSALAGIVVIIFKLQKITNIFTGGLLFFCGYAWLSNMRDLDTWMRSLTIATSNDVFVYWSQMLTFTLMIIFAIFNFFLAYKIASARLKQMRFMAWDIKKRQIVEYDAVINKSKGKWYWIPQDSWGAIKRVMMKFKQELKFTEGDITDTWHNITMKVNPDNIGTRRIKRTINKLLKEIYSRSAFTVKPIKKKKVKPKTRKRKFNYETWTIENDTNLLGLDVPIMMIDGNPKFVDKYKKEDGKEAYDELKGIDKDIQNIDDGTKPKDIDQKKGIMQRFGLFRKGPKPIGQDVRINLSNQNNYDILHFLDEAEYLSFLSKTNTEKDKIIHKLELEQEMKANERAREMNQERNKALTELRGRAKAISEGK